MKRFLLLSLLLLLGALTSGCAGVPLSSAARLVTLNPMEILEGDPANIMFALNASVGIAASREKQPALHILAEPKVIGDYERFARRLEFEISNVDPRTLGLVAAEKNRLWLIYRLSPEAIRGVQEFQFHIANVRKRKEKKGGGNLEIRLENDWLAESYPKFFNSHVQLWMQLNARDRFMEIWSGKLGDSNKV